jgi:manganese/zinc/iron transport system ATP- binding protein
MQKEAQLSSSPAIEFHDLSVAYHKKPVLWGIDLEIPSGSLVGVYGPNGAGKSTLLKAAMGLIPLQSGFVKMFGRDIREGVEACGYVPQRETVDWDFPVTVDDVVTMGRYGKLGLFKRPRKRDRKIVADAIEKVGLTPFANRQIANLSGGQQQRTFLARALAQECDLYLMDEPFAAVDAATERTVVELLKEWRDQGKTVLVVDHDLEAAQRYFDSLILLNLRLVAYGKPQDVLTPENLHQAYGGRLTVMSQVAEAVAES